MLPEVDVKADLHDTPMNIDDGSSSKVTAKNGEILTATDVLRVMEDNPTADDIGKFVVSVRKYREDWNLLLHPENSFIPKEHIFDVVEKFGKKCIKDPTFGGLWICEYDYI